MDTFVLDLLFYVKKEKFARLYKFFSPNDYEKNDEIILKYFQ